MVQFHNDWDGMLAGEFQKPYYISLRSTLAEEYRTARVYPDMYSIFSALRETSFSAARVVLLGQDPYHGPGQAHGLAFSVQQGIPHPPSLQNIFKELCADIGCPPPTSGCLLPWARQGVLLLNTSLTVRAGEPGSHAGLGWETFTDHVVSLLGASPTPRVFLLWGAKAKAKRELIGPQHKVLAAAHPSPLSAAKFFGSRPFSQANQALAEFGTPPINWAL